MRPKMTPAEKHQTDTGEQRSNARYLPDDSVEVEVLADGRRLRGVVQDISVRGMRLALGDRCAVGSGVRLEHPVAGSFSGVCVWSSGDCVGIELAEPQREIERVLQCLCLLVGVRRPGR